MSNTAPHDDEDGRRASPSRTPPSGAGGRSTAPRRPTRLALALFSGLFAVSLLIAADATSPRVTAVETSLGHRPSTDLESRGKREPVAGRIQLVLATAPDRPASSALKAAVDEAWRALRPRAARVELDSWDPRLGEVGCATAVVVDARGRICGRIDGAVDASTVRAWLDGALRLAAQDVPDSAPAAERESWADRLLALGARPRARAAYEALLATDDDALRARARERLARIALLSGDVAEAGAWLSPAPTSAPSARRQHTLGLWRLARREVEAARVLLAEAVARLEHGADPEAARARLDWARAAVAGGETSLALAVLEPLCAPRPSAAPFLGECRAEARRLADSLYATPPAQDSR